MSEKTGLTIDGTVLGQTTISIVDGPHGRLIYRGYDMHELAANATWEEVAHLLWYGELPTAVQLGTLREHLAEHRALTADELAVLRGIPHELHGMDALRTIVSAMTHLHAPAAVSRADTAPLEGLRLTAKLPTLLSTWIRLRNAQEPVSPDPNLGHAANFLLTLHGTPPDEVAARVLDGYMLVMIENGLNISTFVARVVMSTQNNISTAIATAIATLKGLAHGGANEYAMRTFLAIGSPDHAATYIEEARARKERLMGVGHRIFEVEDPRMRHMKRLSEQLATRPDADNTSHAIARRVEEIVAEHPYFQQRRLYPNVEFYSAPLLNQLGFPVDCFTAVFACARMPGWTAHLAEQLADNRLVRPDAEYIGPPSRPFVPLAERG
jgi:citrate synthase